MCIYIHILNNNSNNIYIHYIYIYYNEWIRGMEQRYGTEVWDGSFKQVWDRGVERGMEQRHGTDPAPDLIT